MNTESVCDYFNLYDVQGNQWNDPAFYSLQLEG